MEPYRTLIKFSVLLLLSTALTTSARATDPPPQRPDLTGHWLLNANESDSPRMNAGPNGGYGRGGMRGGREGMPQGGERGTGGGRGGSRGPSLTLPEDMVLELADSELTVSQRGLTVRRLEFGEVKPPDDPKSASPEEALRFPARWDGATIVSEHPSRRGDKVRETWKLSKDGNQLEVRVQIPSSGDRPAVEFRRVYDRTDD
jgi:hypothetical protein